MTSYSFDLGRSSQTSAPSAPRSRRHDGGLASLCSVQQQGGPAADALRVDYGLTAAETRVALALADGLAVTDICASQKIGLTTVRSHLKSIFRKTDTRGQVQLVVLVFKLLRQPVDGEGDETPRQVFRRSA